MLRRCACKRARRHRRLRCTREAQRAVPLASRPRGWHALAHPSSGRIRSRSAQSQLQNALICHTALAQRSLLLRFTAGNELFRGQGAVVGTVLWRSRATRTKRTPGSACRCITAWMHTPALRVGLQRAPEHAALCNSPPAAHDRVCKKCTPTQSTGDRGPRSPPPGLPPC